MTVRASIDFLDISGVGNSGKTAVADLLREVDGVHVPPYWFEFDFIRIPNGLLDLRHRLLEDWSPVRSHYAIKAFCRVAEQMGADPPWWDLPGLMTSSSQRYNRYFGGQFVLLSKAFAHSFVAIKFVSTWPYDDMLLSGPARFVRKSMHKLGLRRALWRQVFATDANDFDMRATAYLNELFSFNMPADCDIATLNNGFEPYNPISGLDMIRGSKQIIVTRDPRDVYVSGLTKGKIKQDDRRLLPADNDGFNKSFLATDNLSEYVRRQRCLYRNLYSGSDPRVLRVRFEDLCLSYDQTVGRILAFLGVERNRHKRPRTCFIPEQSRSGVGLWEKYSGQGEVEYIARALPDLLYGA